MVKDHNGQAGKWPLRTSDDDDLTIHSKTRSDEHGLGNTQRPKPERNEDEVDYPVPLIWARIGGVKGTAQEEVCTVKITSSTMIEMGGERRQVKQTETFEGDFTISIIQKPATCMIVWVGFPLRQLPPNYLFTFCHLVCAVLFERYSPDCDYSK